VVWERHKSRNIRRTDEEREVYLDPNRPLGPHDCGKSTNFSFSVELSVQRFLSLQIFPLAAVQ
jgi:hypothetical protein